VVEEPGAREKTVSILSASVTSRQARDLIKVIPNTFSIHQNLSRERRD
jgi:hypothetical protein